MRALNFDLAKVNHLAWMLKLRGFLDGKGSLKEEEAVSYKDCDLGKWLYEGGLAEHKDILEVQQLEEEHIRLHQAIIQAISQKKSGEIDLSNQTLTEMEPMSHKIVDLLTTIESKIKEKENLPQ